MLFVDAKDFRAAINVVRGVACRSSASILSSVLLTAHKNGKIKLTCADSDARISATCQGTVREPFSFTAPLKELREAASGTEGEIGISKGADHVLVRGDFMTCVKATNAGDFPQGPEFPALPVSMLADELKKALKQVNYAIARNADAARAFLGLFLQTSRSKLHCVATDGRRLAKTELPRALTGDIPSALKKGILVPCKTATELARILPKGKTVQLGVHDEDLFFESGSVRCASRLLYDRFPVYMNAIPTKWKCRAVVPVKKLRTVMQRVEPLLRRSALPYTAELRFTNKELTIWAFNPDKGEVTTAIPVAFEGRPLTLGVNAKHVLDVLKQTKGGTVTLHMVDKGTPMSFEDPTQPNLLQILMPMPL
jgi:DNA polymerase-3 subunit beta